MNSIALCEWHLQVPEAETKSANLKHDSNVSNMAVFSLTNTLLLTNNS